jgi:SAM-dependent methyltransferase
VSGADNGDIRCVECNGSVSLVGDGGIRRYGCESCGAQFDVVWGVPYFGGFESDDVLGLFEITANVQNRGNFGITPETVERWEELLAGYAAAPDKTAFAQVNPDAESPYFANRYGEWLEIGLLTRGVDLRGRAVLDIGAGLGFDSHRLFMRGARVTALEFSPLLAEAGCRNFPAIRWIGGFAHVLPFRSATFDAVFCNAALHHMRDIPAVVSEALRVLRPGGVFITTCDSFRPSASGDDLELSIFDRDPTVLLGVNEGVPRFSDFVEAFSRHPERVRVELFTHTLYDAPSGGTLTELTPWSYESDLALLSQRSGSLAMRVWLDGAWPEPAKLQRASVLRTATLAEWLTSESAASAKLASLLPPGLLDLPFPGDRGSKFELLNGWRLPKSRRGPRGAGPVARLLSRLASHLGSSTAEWRTAYRRGRWFLRRPAAGDALAFEVGLPEPDQPDGGSVQILLDDHLCAEHPLARSSWTPVEIGLASIDPGQVFTVEIRKQGGDDSLAGASFAVRGRRFVVKEEVDWPLVR